MKRYCILFVSVLAMAVWLGGCSLKYAVDDPPAPKFVYHDVNPRPVTLKVVDQRGDAKYMVGISGLQGVDLSLENVEDPVSWLSRELVRELAGRGVAVTLAPAGSAVPADLVLTVNRYQLINHRASGFSAWESYNVFLGHLAAGGSNCRIPAFFFNSKIPVWSMDEIRKPCVSDPMGVMVKDIASKINRCAFSYQADDADVLRLIRDATATVASDATAACFPLIDLAGTNNPAAMAALKRFAEHDDSFVHNCAVNAIGILGAADQFDFLAGRFKHFEANDKVTPLKAIGDIGSARAYDFLRGVQGSRLNSEENGVRTCTDLYLSR